MAEYLLQTEGLFKSFGALMATCEVNLTVREGEVHGLIGPNGAGKTTLLSQISGEIRPDAGSVFFAGREIHTLPVHTRVRLGLARSYQITSIFPVMSTEDNVALAVQARSGHNFRFLKPVRTDRSLREPARDILAQVGLLSRAGTRAGNLSHGEQRQLELAMALATRPKMLLLDEPTAGMGMEDTALMVSLLQKLKGKVTMLLVEHDMDAVFALADRVTVINYGQVIASGSPEAIRRDDEVRQAYLGDTQQCFRSPI